MSKFKSSNMFHSLKYAIRGLIVSIKSQRNFRFDLIIGVLTIILATMLDFPLVEMALVLLVIAFILFAELMNTVVEFVVDAYFGTKYSVLAKMAKDISAGAVFMSAIFAVIIGILLFIPKIIALASKYFLNY